MKVTTHLVYIAIIVLLLLILRECNCKHNQAPAVTVTVVKDSGSTGWYTPVPAFLEGGKIPQPETSTTAVPKQAAKPSGQNRDTAPKYYYSDTARVKYGLVIIQDTTAGPILSRRVLTDFSIPLTTLTALPRAQVYVGINGQYDPIRMQMAAGPSLMLKTKRDHIYEIAALFNPSQLKQPILQGSLKFKIKLR